MLSRLQDDVDRDIDVQSTAANVDVRPAVLEVGAANLIPMHDGALQDVESNEQIQDCSSDSETRFTSWFSLQGQVAFSFAALRFFHHFKKFAFVQIDC